MSKFQISFSLAGKPCRLDLDTDEVLGSGSVGDVYALPTQYTGPNGERLGVKILRGPKHPAYQGNTDEAKLERQIAEERLAILAAKLASYPKGMPQQVVIPISAVVTDRGGTISGFTMRLVENAIGLDELADRDNAQRLGYDLRRLVKVLCGSVDTLDGIHLSACCVGDLNLWNQLIQGDSAHYLDADSFEFKDSQGLLLPCSEFTPHYTDPRILEIQIHKKKPAKGGGAAVETRIITRKLGENFTPLTDWYSLAMVFWEVITGGHMYQGIYKRGPGDPAVPIDEYPLHGLSLFHPSITPPAYSLKFADLPADFVAYFRRIVVDGLREKFPKNVLLALIGAQPPVVVLPAPAEPPEQVAQRQAVKIRGRVQLRPILTTGGVILAVRTIGGQACLLYHEGGLLKRENGQAVIKANLGPSLRWEVNTDGTLIKVGSRAFFAPLGYPPYEVHADKAPTGALYYHLDNQGSVRLEHKEVVHQGALRAKDVTQSRLGAGVTQMFVGNGRMFTWTQLPFGHQTYLYRFSDRQRWTVLLPHAPGEIVQVRALLGQHSAWIFVARREAGIVKHYCYVLDGQGSVVASAWSMANDSSWLGRYNGVCIEEQDAIAPGAIEQIYAPTDNGLEVLGVTMNAIVSHGVVSDTAGLINSAKSLAFVAKNKVLVWDLREVQEVSW